MSATHKRVQRANVKQGGNGAAKPRRCLCCDKTFPSSHAGNRLCGGCRSISVTRFHVDCGVGS